MQVVAVLAIINLVLFFTVLADSDASDPGVVGKLVEHAALLFLINTERAIPTLFAVVLLLLSSALLLLMSRCRRGSDRTAAAYWMLLSLIFLFLAVDEAVMIHERLNKPLAAALDNPESLRFPWVLPYGLAVLAFAGIFLRFWWRLESRLRARIAFAGVLYVTGALGLEVASSWYLGTQGYELDDPEIRYDLVNNFLTLAEESMELTGSVLFVYALLDDLSRDPGQIAFDLRKPSAGGAVPRQRQAGLPRA